MDSETLGSYVARLEAVVAAYREWAEAARARRTVWASTGTTTGDMQALWTSQARVREHEGAAIKWLNEQEAET